MKTKTFSGLKLFLAIVPVVVLLSGCSLWPSYQQTTSTTAPAKQSQQTASQFDVMVADNPTLGKIFTDGQGMTLYTFTKDTKGKSNCYEVCATNWPPLLVSGAPRIGSDLLTSKFGVITRTDGSQQLTFEGMPLYRWAKDVKPGDTNGQGFGGFWFVYKVGSDDYNAPAKTK